MPVRIQRKRTKGWKMPACAVYVGRPTKWGNPWPITPSSKRHWSCGEEFYHRRAVEAFSRWIKDEEQDELLSDIRQELKGKDLACWCSLDQPCHADVLLTLANE